MSAAGQPVGSMLPDRRLHGPEPDVRGSGRWRLLGGERWHGVAGRSVRGWRRALTSSRRRRRSRASAGIGATEDGIPTRCLGAGSPRLIRAIDRCCGDAWRETPSMDAGHDRRRRHVARICAGEATRGGGVGTTVRRSDRMPSIDAPRDVVDCAYASGRLHSSRRSVRSVAVRGSGCLSAARRPRWHARSELEERFVAVPRSRADDAAARRLQRLALDRRGRYRGRLPLARRACVIVELDGWSRHGNRAALSQDRPGATGPDRWAGSSESAMSHHGRPRIRANRRWLSTQPDKRP